MYKTLGTIFAVVMTVMIFNSMAYYMIFAKTGLTEWMLFFPGNLAMLVFGLGYLLNNKIILSLALPALIFFGICGLMLLGWNKNEIPLQCAHITMLLASIWIIYGIFKDNAFQEATFGLICAVFLVSYFVVVEQRYLYQKHWNRYVTLLKFQPEKRIVPRIRTQF